MAMSLSPRANENWGFMKHLQKSRAHMLIVVWRPHITAYDIIRQCNEQALLRQCAWACCEITWCAYIAAWRGRMFRCLSAYIDDAITSRQCHGAQSSPMLADVKIALLWLTNGNPIACQYACWPWATLKRERSWCNDLAFSGWRH